MGSPYPIAVVELLGLIDDPRAGPAVLFVAPLESGHACPGALVGIQQGAASVALIRQQVGAPPPRPAQGRQFIPARFLGEWAAAQRLTHPPVPRDPDLLMVGQVIPLPAGVRSVRVTDGQTSRPLALLEHEAS